MINKRYLLIVFTLQILVLTAPFSLALRARNSIVNSKFAHEQLSTLRFLAATPESAYLEPEGENGMGVAIAPTKPIFKFRNIIKRWITGLSLGLFGTLLIASGNFIFPSVLLIASAVMLSEYYNMVTATNVPPMRALGITNSAICFILASVCPDFHQFFLPISFITQMFWVLTTMGRSASLAELASSVFGMSYLAYLPSFWIRLRSLKSVATITCGSGTALPALFTSRVWTLGACVMWWTWTSIVFSGQQHDPYLLIRSLCEFCCECPIHVWFLYLPICLPYTLLDRAVEISSMQTEFNMKHCCGSNVL